MAPHEACMNIVKAEKEDSQGQLSHDLVDSHSESLVPASPPPGLEVVDVEAVQGPQMAPQFHHTLP